MEKYYTRYDVRNSDDTLIAWGIVAFSARNRPHATRKLKAGLERLIPLVKDNVRAVLYKEAGEIQLCQGIYLRREEVPKLGGKYPHVKDFDLSKS